MKLDIYIYKKNKHIYNNYSGLPFEMQLLKVSSKARVTRGTFQPASSKVKNENDVIRNRISDFDKRRISQPKIQ